MTASAQPAATPNPSRERVLEAALELFADRGYHAVTLRQIAAAAGLHNSSLFHHFGSKQEIAKEVFERVLERTLPLLAPLAHDTPPRLDTLIAALDRVADHTFDARNEARLVLRTILDSQAILDSYVDELGEDDVHHPVVRLFSLVWGWLARAREAGVIRRVNVYQCTRNLFGVMLFEPAYSYGDRGALSPEDLEKRRRERRSEVAAFVRGALEPR